MADNSMSSEVTPRSIRVSEGINHPTTGVNTRDSVGVETPQKHVYEGVLGPVDYRDQHQVVEFTQKTIDLLDSLASPTGNVTRPEPIKDAVKASGALDQAIGAERFVDRVAKEGRLVLGFSDLRKNPDVNDPDQPSKREFVRKLGDAFTRASNLTAVNHLLANVINHHFLNPNDNSGFTHIPGQRGVVMGGALASTGVMKEATDLIRHQSFELMERATDLIPNQSFELGFNPDSLKDQIRELPQNIHQLAKEVGDISPQQMLEQLLTTADELNLPVDALLANGGYKLVGEGANLKVEQVQIPQGQISERTLGSKQGINQLAEPGIAHQVPANHVNNQEFEATYVNEPTKEVNEAKLDQVVKANQNKQSLSQRLTNTVKSWLRPASGSSSSVNEGQSKSSSDVIEVDGSGGDTKEDKRRRQPPTPMVEATVVPTNNVNVRTTPEAMADNSNLIMQATANQDLILDAKVMGDDGYVWYHSYYYNGWVRSDVLPTNVDLSKLSDISRLKGLLPERATSEDVKVLFNAIDIIDQQIENGYPPVVFDDMSLIGRDKEQLVVAVSNAPEGFEAGDVFRFGVDEEGERIFQHIPRSVLVQVFFEHLDSQSGFGLKMANQYEANLLGVFQDNLVKAGLDLSKIDQSGQIDAKSLKAAVVWFKHYFGMDSEFSIDWDQMIVTKGAGTSRISQDESGRLVTEDEVQAQTATNMEVELSDGQIVRFESQIEGLEFMSVDQEALEGYREKLKISKSPMPIKFRFFKVAEGQRPEGSVFWQVNDNQWLMVPKPENGEMVISVGYSDSFFQQSDFYSTRNESPIYVLSKSLQRDALILWKYVSSPEEMKALENFGTFREKYLDGNLPEFMQMKYGENVG